MKIALVGLNHRTAEVEARERLAALPLASVQERLREGEWREAVVLSTCNRFEVLLADTGVPAAEMQSWLIDLLGRLAGRPLESEAYRLEGLEAVEHLFKVASGLDSLVIGESEILGQVKASYESAKAADMTGKTTNVLYQRALNVGKAVRATTAIATGQSSVAGVAALLAGRVFGDLKDCSVLVLGAGKMAELSIKHLSSLGARRLFVANRTGARAVELAARFQAESIAWDDFPGLLKRVDVVIGSTGSTVPVVTAEMVRRMMPERRGRALFFIDIAMPRDVEEGVHALENAYVYTLADLSAIVDENMVRRQVEFDRAKAIVREKAQEFSAWHAASAAGGLPTLKHGVR